MAEFATVSNESKMLYACIKQGVAILEKISVFRTVAIAELFPAQSTQWDKIKKVLALGVSNKIAWTGMSMTKSDNVPDETRVPPQVEVNTNTIRMMHAVAQAEGVTYSSNYVFFDPENNFVDSAATWTQAINAYLEIVNLGNELGLFKIAGAEMEGGTADINRSPAQLLIFNAVEIPLANGNRNVPLFNGKGIEAGFGSFYEDFFLKSINQLIDMAVPELDAQIVETTAAKSTSITNANWTMYEYTAPAGYGLVGILRGEDSDGGYLTSAVYDNASHGWLNKSTLPADAPATAAIKAAILKLA